MISRKCFKEISNIEIVYHYEKPRPLGGDCGIREIPSGLGGDPGKPNLFLSSLEQVFGGEPKQDSGDRKNNREAGNNTFAVFLHEVPGAILVRRERCEELGRTFYGLLFGTLVVLLLHAGLKRF